MSANRASTRGLDRWMDRYIDGDPRAFSHIHAILEPRLRGLLLKLLGNGSPVDDLIQVTLLKAHLARSRFRPQGGDRDGAVLGWYFALARNVAMDHLRERYRDRHRAALAANDAVASLPSPGGPTRTVEDLHAGHEDEVAVIEQVRAAIGQLPAGQREVVELHKLQGMSMAEVARRLDIREGAVRVRAHRAYRALARVLTGANMKGWLV